MVCYRHTVFFYVLYNDIETVGRKGIKVLPATVIFGIWLAKLASMSDGNCSNENLILFIVIHNNLSDRDSQFSDN